jgi:hypothetical protein
VTGVIAVLLLLYAAMAGTGGARWLPRGSWALCAPRAVIATWLATALSVLASVLAAGLILAVPCLPRSLTGAGLNDGLAALRAQYVTLPGALAAAAGGVLVLTVLGRAGWCAVTAGSKARRRRARHDEMLAVVARPGPLVSWSGAGRALLNRPGRGGLPATGQIPPYWAWSRTPKES